MGALLVGPKVPRGANEVDVSEGWSGEDCEREKGCKSLGIGLSVPFHKLQGEIRCNERMAIARGEPLKCPNSRITLLLNLSKISTPKFGNQFHVSSRCASNPPGTISSAVQIAPQDSEKLGFVVNLR